MESLTEKVLAFQRSKDGLEELVTALSPRIYLYPRRKLGWDDDACGDFYLYFQPRLLRLLWRFKEQGRPFESYLHSVMNWQLKNFARERRRSERGWSVALRLERPEEIESSTDDEEAHHGDAIELRLLRALETDSDRRNFLLLTLKCSRSLTPERLSELSLMTGVSEQSLEGYVSALRTRIALKEKRLECFRLRRNRAYSQARLLETELAEEVDAGRRRDLEARLLRVRLRMKKAIERMSKVSLSPTNKEIAEVLDIPKGTVDSGLYWLKKKLALVYDRESSQSA